MLRRLLLAAGLGVCAVLAAAVSVSWLDAPLAIASRAASSLETLTVETTGGPKSFKVELALTPDQRSRGLMFRKEMAPDHGMFFDMGRTAPAYFWMKNTYLSLDIIFIDEHGSVATIAENAKPLSEEMIPSGSPIRYVLELVAGGARRFGIQVGDKVDIPPRMQAQ
ncbi:hypothetical protein HDIA_1947 [Hartmannibacter diazotrophicus]|uniref:ACR n=1 Tax=Hartmannibacter diazotrophicus TaxID=1482074 RepID=A0A2C9D5S1_9HYPH|nr:DUF192 domain-containing protein [Hartmannibacter diazotrophicus]SON55488.1 hypothetical protein HDIA_1947 [Hartmannibacter diazotrophicus]